MKKITFLIATFAYITLLFFVIRNLDTSTLWYDESGQFFIAKGLNHFSSPFAEEGNLQDVIYNNARYNLDPGGFSILLHFWTMVSNHHIWLRGLPFIFYLLTIIFINLTIYEITRSKLFAFIGGLIIFMLIYGNSAYFLRAYSMELFCTVWGLWGILKLCQECTPKRLFTYSVIFALLMTARYSTIMIVFGYSICILYIILQKSSNMREKISQLCIYGIPLLIMVMAIYFISMKIQNANAEQLPYIKYFKDDILGMFNPYHLTLYAFIITIFLFKKHFNKSFLTIFYAFCIIEFLFIILSLVGLQPCDLLGSKNEPLLLLYLICIYTSLYGLISKYKFGYLTTLVILTLFIGFLTVKKGGGSLRNSNKSINYNMAENLNQIDLSQYPKIFVSYWYSATIRYLYEYDHFSHDIDIYKEKFIFGKGFMHNNTGNGVLSQEKLATEKEREIIQQMPKGSLIIKQGDIEGCSKLKDYQYFNIKN